MKPPAIRRRLTLYVSGFDPRGPAHYHRLYREQAALQSATSGHRIEVGARHRIDAQRDGWDIAAHIEGTDVATRYEFLRWDSVVRTHWNPGHWQYLRMTAKVTWRVVRDGSLWRIFKATLPFFSVGFGPFAILLAVVLGMAALLAVLGAAWNTTGISVWTASALAFCLLGSVGLCRVSLYAEHDWHMGWTTRSYWFSAQQGRGQTPDLDACLDCHADRLLQALQDPQWDEVLLVGHSSGAMQATSIAARAIQRAPNPLCNPLDDPRFALLTLAQCLPILTFQPQAKEFRQEVQTVAQALGERWLDFTAPTDRCCAALVDPAEAVRGMDGTDCPSPKILSTRVATLFEPAAYAQLRRDYFKLHFHYICATQLPKSYDFFAITAGPQSLVLRFACQPSVRHWREFERLGGPFGHLRKDKQKT